MTRSHINVTPLVNVLLLLWLLVMLPRGEPRGYAVNLPSVSHECGDSRTVVIGLFGDRRSKVNQKVVSLGSLGIELARIFRFRNERLVYIEASPLVEFREVARVVDIAAGSIEDMHVGLITPGVESELAPNADNCLVLHSSGFHHE